jgi:hypothetical protein
LFVTTAERPNSGWKASGSIIVSHDWWPCTPATTSSPGSTNRRTRRSDSRFIALFTAAS